MQILVIFLMFLCTATSAYADDSQTALAIAEVGKNPDGFWVTVGRGETPSVVALLDTGANNTVLPASLIEELAKIDGEARYTGDALAITADGVASFMSTYILRYLTIDGCLLTNVKVETLKTAGIPLTLIGTPTLKQMGVVFSMSDGHAEFFCESDGRMHTVESPHQILKTSPLSEAAQ